MKRLLKYLSIFACLAVALSSCEDYVRENDTRKDEYTIYYCITYSTVYDFHNIAYINYTDFNDPNDHFYTGIARQEEHSITSTSAYFFVNRVPKGSQIQLSTYVDVPEALPNTKVEISIEVSTKGGYSPYTEVAKAEADCPLKDNPLTISCDVPNK